MLRNNSKSAAAKEKGEFYENDANNSSKPAVWLAACQTRAGTGCGRGGFFLIKFFAGAKSKA